MLNLEFDRNLIARASEIVRGPGLARYHPNFQCSHILFGESLLSADTGIGARFLSAYLRGAQEFARGSTPRFMEEFARSGGLDVKLVTGACRHSFTLDGSVDLHSLQLFVDWAVRRKYIPQPVDVAELDRSPVSQGVFMKSRILLVVLLGLAGGVLSTGCADNGTDGGNCV